MPTDCISYQKSGYFAKLIIDYLDEKPELKSMYNRFPTLENFKSQLEEKAQNYPVKNRESLVTALENQYNGFQVSEATKGNISLLSNTKTFTVTTGHQLNLFTGPLYFLYKIVSTINLCATLKKENPTPTSRPGTTTATGCACPAGTTPGRTTRASGTTSRSPKPAGSKDRTRSIAFSPPGPHRKKYSKSWASPGRDEPSASISMASCIRIVRAGAAPR